MGSLYSYVHVFFQLTMVDIVLRFGDSPGWFILWSTHRVCRTPDPEFASKPRKPVGILSESIRSDA